MFSPMLYWATMAQQPVNSAPAPVTTQSVMELSTLWKGAEALGNVATTRPLPLTSRTSSPAMRTRLVMPGNDAPEPPNWLKEQPDTVTSLQFVQSKPPLEQ